MTYTSPTWVDVPPGTTPPAGAVALDATNMQALTDEVARLGGVVSAVAALTPTVVKSANYTLAVNDLVPFDLTAASRVGTLPTAPADKSQVLAYIHGFGAGHTLTLTAGGSDHIEQSDGSAGTTVVRSVGSGESVWLQYDRTNALWRQLPDRIPLSVLDARYNATYALLSVVQPLESAGVLANGSTDNAATINTALATLGAGTAAFQNHSGVIGIKSPIIVPNGCALVGTGAMQGGTTIQALSGFPTTTVNGLQTTPASSATTFALTVASTAGFPLGVGGITPPHGTGVLCVAGITIFYTGTTSTTFTGCRVQAADTSVALADGRALSTFMVWLDDPGDTGGYGTRIDNVGIDCNSIAGISGIHSCHVQEGGGGRNLRVTKFANFGVRIDSNPASAGSAQAVNEHFEKLWLIFSSTAEAESVGFDALKTFIATGTAKVDSDRGLRDASIVVQGSVNVVGKAGVRLNAAAGSYADIHLEDMNAGVLVGDIYRASVNVDNVWAGNNWGTGGILQIGNIAGNAVRARNIGKSDASTVPARIVVNDLLNGITLTDEQADYAIGGDGLVRVNGGGAAGLRSARPTAGTGNRGVRYLAKDTGVEYVSDGLAWRPVPGPRLVQDAVATGARDNSSASTLTVTLAKDTSVGNLLLMAAGESGNFAVSSIVDSRSNTWTVAKTATGQGMSSNICYCIPTTALQSGDTITITFAGASTYASAIVSEWDGMKGYSITDINGTNQGASGAPAIASFGPTTQANEILYVVQAYTSSNVLTGTNLTSLTAQSSGAGVRTVAPFYRFLDTAANVNPVFTGSVANWTATAVTFRAKVPA